MKGNNLFRPDGRLHESSPNVIALMGEMDRLVAAMRGMNFGTPFGAVTFRAIDQQATMGAYVGTLDQKDGKGFMRDWHYADGKSYLPDEDSVRNRRPAAAMK